VIFLRGPRPNLGGPYYTVLLYCMIDNMGMSDLPEIYARARGCAAPECKCVHFRQIKSAHVITNIFHCPCRLIAYYGWPKATSYAMAHGLAIWLKITELLTLLISLDTVNQQISLTLLLYIIYLGTHAQ